MSAPVDLSLGEYRTLVAKAFRGAGYPWGLTEDASFAAKRLAEFGLPSAEFVVELLTTVDGREVTSLMPRDIDSDDQLVCPVCLGVCLADTDAITVGAGSSMSNVVAPALVAPLLATCLRPDEVASYLIEWNGGRCEVSTTALVMSGQHPARGIEVHISKHERLVDPVPRQDRVGLSGSTLRALETFAHRTYAPATEASRLAGAGPS